MNDDITLTAETSLADETYRALLDDILAARLAGGAIVQERRLATKLGVSRSPMRDALGRLEGQGLLVRNSKSVLTVRVITLQDYLNSLAMRFLVEPSAAALASAYMEIDHIDKLQAMLDRINADADPDPSMVWQFDDALHNGIGEASGNPFMAETIIQMRRYTTIFERQRRLSQRKPGIADHHAILEALRSRDADSAREFMSLHLERVRDGVLSTY